ncbi:MAG: sugar phosphate isomerase/epimerase [Planctomycetes bacterium]|nr:sugar phosphate isomerase/epimerase [Planctomycetota bacterium]
MDASIFQESHERPDSISRREALRWSALWGAALAGTGCAGAAGSALTSAASAEQNPPGSPGADSRKRSPKSYPMKKSINLWAFPYPKRMTLEECFRLAREAGFDAVEVNYNLEDDLSPKASEKEIRALGELARKIGIEVSGVCSFLFWPYPLTASDPEKRRRAMELAENMLLAASWLGTKNLLVVPGAVYIPWRKDSEEVPYDVVDRRAKEAVARMIPLAEKHQVHINIENIFFNGYLMSPPEMTAFVDSFQSPWVKVHFDTGNIMPFQFPEHWIPMIGKRIQNVHLKEYSKAGTDFSIESFRPLLDGTTNWPAVIEAFDAIGYRGYLTFEYFHPFPHYPEALVYWASDALNRLLGRG